MLKKYVSLALLFCFTSGVLAAPLHGVENTEVLFPPKHQKIIRSYQKKALKYASRETAELVAGDEEELLKFYSEKISLIAQGEPVRFSLADGWYVVWFKTLLHFKTGSVAYAGEYDDADKLVGFIKIKRVKKKVFMFYEYRTDEAQKSARLTHVMLLHNNKHQAAFVFNTTGELQAYQYDGNIYSLRFAMPGIQPLELKLPSKSAKDVAQDVVDTTAGIAKGTAKVTVEVTKTAAEVALSPLGGVAMLVFMVAMIASEADLY